MPRLKLIRITTVPLSLEKLLEAGATPSGRKKVAKESEISDKLILTWVNKADLTRVKGISTQYADLLKFAGVDTVPELAQRKAENLQLKMAELNAEKSLVRKVPTTTQVEEWVAQAKELPRVITH